MFREAEIWVFGKNRECLTNVNFKTTKINDTVVTNNNQSLQTGSSTKLNWIQKWLRNINLFEGSDYKSGSRRRNILTVSWAPDVVTVV